jgi:hypothetical protein
MNYGFHWRSKTAETAIDKNGMSWRWHAEDDTHSEHWDCVDKDQAIKGSADDGN